ncbi:hypothetical protein O3P69_002224 [Scylla paramamosain]|uniref:Uncharacterized protein n=1 Tax=Scylla paramamosain TaxID=85552 RepID=A0AAW0V6F1_SCYPA
MLSEPRDFLQDGYIGQGGSTTGHGRVGGAVGRGAVLWVARLGGRGGVDLREGAEGQEEFRKAGRGQRISQTRRRWREYAGRSNTAITEGRFRQGGQRRTTKLFSDAAPLTSPAAHQPRNPWTGTRPLGERKTARRKHGTTPISHVRPGGSARSLRERGT